MQIKTTISQNVERVLFFAQFLRRNLRDFKGLVRQRKISRAFGKCTVAVLESKVTQPADALGNRQSIAIDGINECF